MKILIFFLSCFLLFDFSEAQERNRDISANESSKVNLTLEKLSQQHFFIENKKQWIQEVKFLTRTNGQDIWFLDNKIRFNAFTRHKNNLDKTKEDNYGIENEESIHTLGHVWDIEFQNSNIEKYIVANDKKMAYYNYFIGSDSTKWASKVGLYNQITYKNLYKNIDLKFYENENAELEYDFIIAPYTDYRNISFTFQGLNKIRINEQGELLLGTQYLGELPISKPLAYQFVNGDKISIPVKYILEGKKIGFELGKYNKSLPLVIDPTLKYSTYLSCINCDDYNYDIDVNSALEAVVTGYTISPNFPTTPGAYSTVLASNPDVYVSKINPDASNLIFSTFIGGSSTEIGYSISYDNMDNVILTGYSMSLNFPTFNNIFASTTSVVKPFLTKLASNGASLVFSTLIPSSNASYAYGITTDDLDNIYTIGYTSSNNFPTTTGVVKSTNTSNQDGFIMKFSPNGSSLIFSTYIGGTGADYLRGVRVDDDYNIYAVGYSGSTNFHLTTSGYDKMLGGTQDGVLIKLSPDASYLKFATYVGGSGSDYLYSLTLDKDRNVYMIGVTSSTNFPTTTSAYKPSAAVGDIVIACIDSSGMNLKHSTAWGNGSGFGIDVNECGSLLLYGYTSSTAFPVTSDALFKVKNSGMDNVIGAFDSSLSTLLYSTYIGGNNSDYGQSSVVSKSNGFYISSTTHSTDYPTSTTAFQKTKGASADDAPVIYSFSDLCFLPNPIITADPLFFCDTTSQTVTLKGKKTAGGCNSDTTNVIIKWTKGYQRIPIGVSDSISILLKFNDTIYGQAIDTLNLCKSKEFIFITQYVYSTIDTFICSGKSYFFNGANRTVAGIYKDTFLTGLNCDSVVILNLKVIAPIYTNYPYSICPGDSILWNGVYRKTNGSYRDTFSSIQGCDSIVTLNLSYIPYKYSNRYDTICFGDSILWNGKYEKYAGTYKDSFMSSLNCDSIVTLFLSLKFPPYYYAQVDICQGSSYIWNGNSYNTSGIYADTFIGAGINGCDSFDNLNLIVHSPDYDTFKVDICDGNKYLWNGQTLDQTGYFPDTFASIYGCDSFIWLHLIVHPIEDIIIDTPICANQYFLWKGNNYNTVDTLRDTTLSVYGCDSFTTYRLSITPVKTFSFYDTTCLGAIYTWNGVNLFLSGSYKDTFVSSENCDSIVTVHLHVKPNSIYNVYDTICESDSIFWNGLYEKYTGNYSDTLVNLIGCDSIVILNLYVKSYRTFTIDSTICALDTIVFSGKKLFLGGTYYDTIFSSTNLICDSITRLNLTVRPYNQTNVFDTICVGQIYIWNNDSILTSGIYKDTFTSIAGCDSFVILSIFQKPKPIIDTYHCFSKNTIFNFRQKSYKTSGLYKDSTNYIYDCDTIFILHLSEITPIITKKDTFSCNAITMNGYSYSKNDSIISVVKNYLGCDSLINKTYIHIANPIRRDTTVNNFCDSFLYKGVYSYSNKQFYDTIRSNQTGECDSIISTIKFIKHPKPVVILSGTHFVITRGEEIEVSASGANRYLWSTAASSSSIIIAPRRTKDYYVIGWNDYCFDSAFFDVVVISDSCRIEFPKAFTPNGDGNNDFFLGRAFEGAKLTSLKIFDRWGQLLFYTTDINEGWNGYYKDILQNSEPYFYTYEADLCVPGKKASGEGNFMLLR